jgi:pyruvate,orthophosphate dikinase
MSHASSPQVKTSPMKSSVIGSSRIQSHPRMTQHILAFEEGNKDMKDLLGGKGANLAEMTLLNLPVPPGFTITTEVCRYFLEHGDYPTDFSIELKAKLTDLERKIGKKFGDRENPLLVSVRSGAKVSMPGMMDTILNLGLNDETVEGLFEKTGNERFCFDAYRRFVNMFGNVVLGIQHELFEEEIDKIKAEKGVKLDTELDATDLRILVKKFKEIVAKDSGKPFPEDPQEQLMLAIRAVFESWNSGRAVTYRRLHEISGLYGTAVNVQAMVFGNMGNTSGTGVAFTRNPSTGVKEFYGEFLMNAQGEDVVAGIRTPQKLTKLQEVMPEVFDQLNQVRENLEHHYRDMQDIEFTIQEGKLFMLQTRNGKRTARAAVKIAADMVSEGLISQKEALLRIDASALKQLLHPDIDPDAPKKVIAKGLPASPGAACGKVVFSADEALEWAHERDEKVILVRKETSPEDIHGMHSAEGILTSTGGMTSHAAVVCRGMGKCCVAGCSEIRVDAKNKLLLIGDLTIKEGDIITLNGSTGEVMLGEMQMVEPEITEDFQKILGWADEVRKLKIRANADTPFDAKVARDFGAEGIGLCRTEHMFFDENRIKCVREMILAKNTEGRKKALQKLLPMQREDFLGIFEAMNGLPVTIRLLDPPLHEFLPQKEEQLEELAKEMSVSLDELKRAVDNLHEVNPMLGHRGCRLGITYPEIYEMQVQAIIEAGIEATKNGIKVLPEIEVPLVGNMNELKIIRKNIEKLIEKYRNEIKFEYKIGSMIELPRACLTADELANEADFFSFGTNDLTQTTFGLSRDDSGKFLNAYLEQGIFERDPAAGIDQIGVGRLMQIGVELARKTKPGLEIGICGEHGGDPESIKFCHQIGLDYVSCSPYRVPIARVAAAQAALG